METLQDCKFMVRADITGTKYLGKTMPQAIKQAKKVVENMNLSETKKEYLKAFCELIAWEIYL